MGATPPELPARLAGWLSAGLISAEQVGAITEFEEGEAGRVVRSRPEPQGSGSWDRITAMEVMVTAGVALVIGGLYIFIGTHHDQLGAAGRGLMYALVALATLVAAWQLWSKGSAATRRAAGTLAVVGVISFGLVAYEVFTALQLFSVRRSGDGYPGGGYVDSAGDAYAATAVVSLVAFLLMAVVSLPAVVLVAVGSLYVTIFGSLDLAGVRDSVPVTAAALLAGLLTLAIAEFVVRRGVDAAILRFSLVVPVLTCYIVPRDGELVLQLAGVALAIALFFAAVRRGSNAYTIAGGIGIFGFVVDIGGRYLESTLGLPLLFIGSGLLLVGLAAVIQRCLWIEKTPVPAGGGELAT